jgi:hypothetical protein
MVYCAHCGKALEEPIPFYCPFCGKQNIAGSVNEEVKEVRRKIAEYGFKNPNIAALLGLIIPGLGHVYVGNVGFAFILFIFGAIITYVTGIAGLLVSLASAWMAHDEVVKSNAAINRLIDN